MSVLPSPARVVCCLPVNDEWGAYPLTQARLKEREGREGSIPKKTGGYGIRNVKERISAYLGVEYGVSILNRDEGGTRVEVTLPLLVNRPKVS